MPCLLAAIAIFFPRFMILAVAIFSDYLGRAYDNWFWPVLGFFFLPLTTLTYAWAINSNGSVDGLHLVAVIIAVLVDLGIIGGSATAKRK